MSMFGWRWAPNNLSHPVAVFSGKVAGGTSILKRSLQQFLPSSVATTVLVDLHGYDAWPALATLEDTVNNRSDFQDF